MNTHPRTVRVVLTPPTDNATAAAAATAAALVVAPELLNVGDTVLVAQQTLADKVLSVVLDAAGAHAYSPLSNP